MMTASSPSKSTRSVSLTGYLIASLGPVTEVDGLRKITGSVPAPARASVTRVLRGMSTGRSAGRLTLKDVRIVDALDFLSLQTRTFWNVKESSGTILVAPDTQAVRQELEPRTEKVIPLRNIQTPVGTVEIVTALRTLLNIRYVEGNANGIVLKDTSDNTALVEKLVADLDRLPRY